MENSYGIGVNNRFELFYNDDVDPLDLLKESEQKVKDNKIAEKENKGTTKGVSKKSSILKKNAKLEQQPAKIVDKTNTTGESRPQNRGGPRNNDSRVKFQDREERNNRRNRGDDFNNSNRFEGGEGGGGGGRGRGVDGESRPRYNNDGGEGRPRYNNDGGEGRPRYNEGEGGRGRGGRGRGMGRGRGRGRGGVAGGQESRGKREFDRQSGMVTSGVKAVDKREGSGSYNWGSDKDQIEDYQQNQQQQVTTTETETPELDTSAENVEKTEDAPPATTESDEGPKEEEQREMTLDEWKSLQKQRSKPQFNLRKAGEGENTTQWKKTYVLKKKEEEDDDSEDEEEEDDVHHGRRKVLLDIDFKFTDSPMRGRGRGRGRGGERGGRGGERGGRGGRGGMGGERGERPPAGMGRGERTRGGRMGGGRQEAPRMDDEHDFPSLG